MRRTALYMRRRIQYLKHSLLFLRKIDTEHTKGFEKINNTAWKWLILMDISQWTKGGCDYEMFHRKRLLFWSFKETWTPEHVPFDKRKLVRKTLLVTHKDHGVVIISSSSKAKFMIMENRSAFKLVNKKKKHLLKSNGQNVYTSAFLSLSINVC